MNELHTLLLLLILAIYFVWLHYYKKYQLDLYRQDIFRIRDDLFLFAAQGNISFDNDAYILARTYLNGSIRFAERSSLLRIIIMRIKFEEHRPEFQKKLENTLKELTTDQKNAVSKALNKTVNRTVLYICDKNVLIVTAYQLIKNFKVLKSIIRSLLDNLMVEYKNNYSDAVYDEGRINYA